VACFESVLIAKERHWYETAVWIVAADIIYVECRMLTSVLPHDLGVSRHPGNKGAARPTND
jgi:hypothetical protein